MTLLTVHLFYGYPHIDLQRFAKLSYSWEISEISEDVIHRYYPFRLKRLLGGGRK